MNKKIILILGGGIIFIISLFYIYHSIIYPSFQSYLDNCGYEDLSDKNYITLATTQKDTSGNITILFNEVFEEKNISIPNYVLKHENCHIIQYKNNRSNKCDFPYTNILLELECYTADELPDYIYNSIYGDY